MFILYRLYIYPHSRQQNYTTESYHRNTFVIVSLNHILWYVIDVIEITLVYHKKNCSSLEYS